MIAFTKLEYAMLLKMCSCDIKMCKDFQTMVAYACIVSTLGSLRQEEHKFEPNLNKLETLKSYFKNKKGSLGV